MSDPARPATLPSGPAPPAWHPPDPSRWGAPRIVGVTLVALAGVAIGMARLVGEARYQSVPERLPQAAAFGLLVASPAVLGALSPRRRAILLAPAALLLTPLAFLSFAGVLLPLLVVAVLYWTALATRWDGMPCGLVRGVASVVVVPLLVIGGGVALFAHQDPRTYGDGTSGCALEHTASSAGGSCTVTAGGGGSGGTSDVVTPIEAAVSLGLLGAAFGVGWVLAGPRRRGERGPVRVRGRRGG